MTQTGTWVDHNTWRCKCKKSPTQSDHVGTCHRCHCVKPDEGTRPVKKEELKGLDLSREMSYTYAATVDRVIDGDTLLVIIEAGFRIIVRDRLRLRGIDCPEVGTPEGDRAKRFVEKLLPAGAAIVLKSHKDRTDQHGRFVVDVFYKQGCEDPAAIIQDGTYLNQELLDKGYAVRMAE